jgi:hypothetical protein
VELPKLWAEAWSVNGPTLTLPGPSSTSPTKSPRPLLYKNSRDAPDLDQKVLGTDVLCHGTPAQEARIESPISKEQLWEGACDRGDDLGASTVRWMPPHQLGVHKNPQ